MKKVIILLIAIFAIGILIGIRAQKSDEQAEQELNATKQADETMEDAVSRLSNTETIALSDTPIVVPDIAALGTTTELEAAIAELENSLTISTEVRQLAAAELEKTEVALEELEQYVEDIEARGEDPSDFADEGLEKFQPAFYQYEERLAVLEQAEQMEQAVAEALQEARDKLARSQP